MRRNIPSLNWLRVFEAAARGESFSGAAELLNMSTSAVSQQIKALENHLGEPLFKRGPRHVELTVAGHAFLPTVRQSLNTIEETADSLFGAERYNALTLQATLIFATSWLAPRLPEFAMLYPEIQLHMTAAYHETDFQRPGSELRILFGPVHRSWPQCEPLFDETIYPVATAEIAQSIQSPEDLLHHRLIQVSSHRINWNQILRSIGIEDIPTSQFCFVDSSQIALSMAASGYGVALARRPTTNWLAEQLSLEPCKMTTELKSLEAYYLVYQNLENLSASAKVFRHWLLNNITA
ncbi:MAG: LysR family glycine cleavage system transcriptional activator [Polaribacter sp.]|jgi:LysR family glycine cleavage system transcriptional activator